MLLVLIIIIIVFIVVKRLLKDQDNVENGGRDADIRQLYNYYDLVRSNIGALGSDVITLVHIYSNLMERLVLRAQICPYVLSKEQMMR